MADGIPGPGGLERLRGMMSSGVVLPFAGLMRMSLVVAEPGRVVFEGVADESFLNPMGVVHGGWISTLLDSAMGCAVLSLLGPGQVFTTTTLAVHFTRALRPGGAPVRCEGTALHARSRLGTAEGRLLDADGKLIAHGSEACMILSEG